MAWFHEPAFTRLIIYSPSVVPIQKSADYPSGAQAYPDTLIPNSPKKPLRIWMQVGSNDLNNQYGSWPKHNNQRQCPFPCQATPGERPSGLSRCSVAVWGPYPSGVVPDCAG